MVAIVAAPFRTSRRVPVARPAGAHPGSCSQGRGFRGMRCDVAGLAHQPRACLKSDTCPIAVSVGQRRSQRVGSGSAEGKRWRQVELHGGPGV